MPVAAERAFDDFAAGTDDAGSVQTAASEARLERASRERLQASARCAEEVDRRHPHAFGG